MTEKPLPQIMLMIASADVPRSLLELEIAGTSLRSHLAATLAPLRDVRVLMLDRLDPTTASEHAAEQIGEVAEILISDAGVWFSLAALERMLLLGGDATSPLKVVGQSSEETGSTGPKELLALYLPPLAASAFLRKNRTQRVREGVAQVSRSLRGSREVTAIELDSEQPARRVRSLMDLSKLEKDISRSRATTAMRRGVRIRDPDSVCIRGELSCGERVEIDVNVIIEGRVTLGDDVKVGAHSILIDATIGPRSQVNPFSIVEKAEVGADTFIGPYARVRPGCVISDSVQIGNFVEIKNSEVGAQSRINHLTFVGDATLGRNVTLGAGTITCNHNRLGVARTQIGNGAYIGSGTELVAPVSVGEGATIGAGSTITHAVPAGQLTVARARQVTVPGWKSAAQRSDEGG